MAIPPLPLEIIDLVIDQLREDGTTLKSCSLLCRAWVPRARHHLFLILNVRGRLIPALHLLQSPVCTIHPHLRGLKFCVGPTDTVPMAELIRGVNARSTLLILRMKTASGSGLTLVNDDLQALLPTLKHLRYLKLEYFRFRSHEHRIGLLASLPALESLIIDGVRSNDSVDSHNEESQNSWVYTTPPPAKLRQMFLGTAKIPHELLWLTSHCGHPLTTLQLHNITPKGLPITLDYLRQSSHLQCLGFDFRSWNPPEDLQLDLMARVDLTSHQDLRCLRLISIHVIPMLFSLLPRLFSAHIEEMTISAGGYDYVDFASESVDLHEIFMGSPAVRSLKRLYVDEENIDEISEALPEFASRGVILPLHGDAGRGTAGLRLTSILH